MIDHRVWVGALLGCLAELAVAAETPAPVASRTQLQQALTALNAGQVEAAKSILRNLVAADEAAPVKAAVAPVAAPAPAQKSVVATETGFDAGFQVSGYRYQEHVPGRGDFMHLSGPKFGITAKGTMAFRDGLWMAGDFRFAYGFNEYRNYVKQTKSGIPDYLWDVRVLGGKDFIFENVSLAGRSFDLSVSPFTGFGYRNLLNDARGSYGNNTFGYFRDSEYFYVPVGFTSRLGLGSQSRVSATFEYDYLAFGRQISYLSDVGPRFPDLANDQNSGYGLRGSVFYEQPNWSIGPYFIYWDIDRSDFSARAYEPHNQTVEYGAEGRYRF
ncbi:MAG: hypothetical protein FIA97_11705 [Methylococcaceae bacterium]|nr:hypothetical protein [Methylococcaceae bacterium]